jgi:hypothetical protein
VTRIELALSANYGHRDRSELPGVPSAVAIPSWTVDAPEKIAELAADTLRAWALDEDLKRRN